MANLHFDGFYYSGAYEWEDWHAGVRMHGIRYSYDRYYESGEWISCYRDHEFDFWNFTESVTSKLMAQALLGCAPRIGDADPLCTAGHYTLERENLITVFSPSWSGGMTWEQRFLILEDRLVVSDAENHSPAILFQPKPISHEF